MKKLVNLILSAYRHAGTEDMSDETLRSDTAAKVTVSLLLCAASGMLTLLNIINCYWFMMCTTLVLVFGFALCALLFGRLHKRRAAIVVMGILVGFIFSVYAIEGENEGFAILWILLVPLIGMALIGLRAGTVLSAYFQLFLILLFYTPMRDLVAAYYTKTFCIRFPLLYLTSFAASVLLTAQKEYYFQKTENMAFMDALTGVYNRRYYDAIRERLLKKGKLSELTLVSVDVNRLKYTNDTYGHQAGDQLLLGAVRCFHEAFPDAEAICRTGGDEFIIVTLAKPAQVRKDIDGLVKAAEGVHMEHIPSITLSIGVASHVDHPEMSFEELENAADAAMYISKEDFYRRNHTGRGMA